MKGYDLLLFKSAIFSCIGSLLLLIGAISFFKGRNIFNGFTKIDTKNSMTKVMATKVLPVILIIMAIWFCGKPILDLITKDYKDETGTLRKINAPYNYVTTEELFIEGESTPYYLPKGLLRTGENGKEYKFKYGRWSRIILEIEEIKK